MEPRSSAGLPLRQVERPADVRGNRSAQPKDDVPPAAFFDSGTLVVPRIVEALASETVLRMGVDGRTYRYVDGVYRSDGDTFVRTRTRELLGDKFARRHTEEVLAFVRARFPEIGER